MADDVDEQGMLREYAINTTAYAYVCSERMIRTLHSKSAYVKDTNANNEFLILFSVSFNKIIHIPENLFTKLINLVNIHFRDNLISIINSYVFKNNKKLQYIELSLNKISVFNLELNTFPHLRRFAINTNRLTVLKENLFKNFISKNNTLEIYDNKFICDCDMDWLPNMTGQIKSTIIIKTDICSGSLYGITVECFIKKTSTYGKCVVETVPICNNG